MNLWLSLLLKYGFDAAYQIWQTWRDKTDPTEADWQQLKALIRKTEADYVKEAAERAGVPVPPS